MLKLHVKIPVILMQVAVSLLGAVLSFDKYK